MKKAGIRAVLGGVTLLASFLSATAFPQNPDPMQNAKNENFDVDSIFLSPAFKQKGLSGIPYLLEEKEYYKLEDGTLYKVQRQAKGKDKKKAVIESTAEGKPQRFLFNADYSRVLLLSDIHAIYRHSATCKAVLWSLDAKGRFSDPWVVDTLLQEPLFSPDGQKLAFVRQGNLYVADLQTREIYAITTDGKENEIRNGHTDWVYEEEFGFTRAFDWRGDSKAVAWLKFDESALKQYDMTVWGDLYPQTYRYKYPKAGEDNSKVSLWTRELQADGKPAAPARRVALQADSVEYLPRMFYQAGGDRLIFYTLNRHQNHLRIWALENNGTQTLLYEERNAAYVEVSDDIHFFADGSRMLLSSERDGYRHLYLYKTDGTDAEGVLLTPGMYDVTALYGVDEAHNRVFFQAAYSSPANLDLMCVNLDGSNLRRPALDMQRKGGSTHAWFNKDFSYMIVEHSNANQAASYYLYYIGPEEEQLVECILANNHFEQTAQRYGFVKKEFLRIPVPLTDVENNAFMQRTGFGRHRFERKDKGEDSSAGPKRQVYLQAWIMKPAEIGTPAAEGKKYPVLMFLYGGPGSQQVCNSLRPYQSTDYCWYQMLVKQGYIVVCVDNRGTGGRGEAFKKCTYMQIGRYETEDQVAAARYLSELPYVDASRIGIWGWSYGGFMSSNCLLRGEGVFKAAMAVAPVTHWKFYDNVYTERFMRTPQENPDGYELNSPLHYAGKLQGAYLLVHGTGDDNVHVQNAIEMMTALQKANKPFDMMLYPNKNHGMEGKDGSARRHLYHKLTRFLYENL